jgi:putative flippase GtrA
VKSRFFKFNAVGMAGAVVQLAVLWALTRVGVHYLVATAIAVEAALLHNYFWHVRWTWKDREGSLLRFHLGNGLVSLIANLGWMRLFTGTLGLPPLPANVVAILLTALLNFALGERWVFLREPPRHDAA